jgi:hypothetical protein
MKFLHLYFETAAGYQQFVREIAASQMLQGRGNLAAQLI